MLQVKIFLVLGGIALVFLICKLLFRFSLPSQNITLPQQPPASAPVDVAASARSSSSVMVQWQPPKSEQWNGDILGYMIRYRYLYY